MSSAKLTATKNYDLFELLRFNRDVMKTKALEKSMKTHGFIAAYPLHVVRNGNGKLKIKAGHHRFVVAKKLGLPVWYVICDDGATIHELENATTKWTLNDYLQSFCRCGMEEYQRVADYMERTGIPTQSAVSLLGGHLASSGQHGPVFKAGVFKITDNEYAEQVGDVIQHCKRAGFPFACNTLFVLAVSRVMRVTQFSATEFKHKVDLNASMLKRQPHLAGYMEMIESIYNRQRQNKIPLVFLTAQTMKERNAIKG